MPSTQTQLYPPIRPYDSGMLKVDARHALYWEQCGNPDGVPVVFLHGGPGAGASPIHRRFFDPDHYRIVVFDQRGSGRSRPVAETRDNTTAHLVSDIEALRTFLGIEKWLVFGGSWGSSLGLAYGVAHPDRCLGFILRGIFMCSQEEVDWFLFGMGKFYPEAWQRFIQYLPENERDDPLTHYHKRLMSEDETVSWPAAQVWAGYEEACATLVPPLAPNPVISREIGKASLPLARLEADYFVNDCFLAKNHLADNLHKIAHLPCTIVQGRYDVICPPHTARKLADALPGAKLVLVAEGGHSALDPGIREGLVKATEAFKAL